MNPFDEIGKWSEIKLEIIRKYANAYTTILSKQKFDFYYIDAFCGPGYHISKETGIIIEGSPSIAYNLKHKFKRYFFIDIDGDKIGCLNRIFNKDNAVNIYKGDCNSILMDIIFPQCRYNEYKRALCLLDPYGLHLDWDVIEQAGKMKSIEIFLNFPLMDMNRNVLWTKKLNRVNQNNKTRMDRFWGDNSWFNYAYDERETLFEDIIDYEKKDTGEFVKSFVDRLKEKAGFGFVPEPIPIRMDLSQGPILYYLFFASQKAVASDIVDDIFNKYKKKAAFKWQKDRR